MAFTRGQQDPESGLYRWTDGNGAEKWAGADGSYAADDRTANVNDAPTPSYGSPWANDRTGWDPENADALFDRYARSEAGAVGSQTLAALRANGVSDQAAIDALWKGASESANPNWAGGSPTGIMRGIWQHAGILDKIDTPQLRAAQGREDHDIWAGQQKNGDDGFGAILGMAAIAAGIYFGVGALGAEAAMANAGYEGLASAGLSGGASGYTATNAFAGPSLLDSVASKFTPENIAVQAGKTAVSSVVLNALAPEQSGLIQAPSTYGYTAPKVAAPVQGASDIPSFATAINKFQPIFNRTA